MRITFFIIVSILLSNNSFSQAASYTDPAIAYQRVLIEKGAEGTYQQIGNFKVIGTSYLFGEKLSGAVYSPSEKSELVKISFNTYNQQLDINLDNFNQTISKSAVDADSFFIYNNNSEFLKSDLVFYSSRLINPSLKPAFYQVLSTGPRFSLYKNYTSVLDIVSTNYIQSDLRQFSIECNYFYKDNKTNELKKIKLSRKKLIDEFKGVLDLSPFADNEEINKNPEIALKKIFTALNNF